MCRLRVMIVVEFDKFQIKKIKVVIISKQLILRKIRRKFLSLIQTVTCLLSQRLKKTAIFSL